MQVVSSIFFNNVVFIQFPHIILKRNASQVIWILCNKGGLQLDKYWETLVYVIPLLHYAHFDHNFSLDSLCSFTGGEKYVSAARFLCRRSVSLDVDRS